MPVIIHAVNCSVWFWKSGLSSQTCSLKDLVVEAKELSFSLTNEVTLGSMYESAK